MEDGVLDEWWNLGGQRSAKEFEMLTSTPDTCQDLITQVAENHWVLLSQDSRGNWGFLLWGDYPLSENLGPMSEDFAKEQALVVAKQHLQKHGLQRGTRAMPTNRWKVAMHCIAA
jgi:hypothetical protein